MIRHSIDTVTDDLALLKDRLDELSGQGARILAVVWQPRRAEPEDQAAAFDDRGSFIIISQADEIELRAAVLEADITAESVA